jgi:hypothetical protein
LLAVTDPTEDDSVGYGRPPKRSRFQRGRSGNPAGRPKHRLSFRAALLAELAAAMPGKDQRRAGSKLQALVKTLVDKAIAGDARAQSLLVSVLARVGETEDNAAASLTSDDQVILDAYVSGQLKQQTAEAEAALSLGDEKAE